jgi:hypothetical protein
LALKPIAYGQKRLARLEREFSSRWYAPIESDNHRRSRKRAVAVVFPGARSAIVVGHDNEIQVIRHHIRKIFRAEVPDALQIAPRRVRMKVADYGEMRKIIQETCGYAATRDCSVPHCRDGVVQSDTRWRVPPRSCGCCPDSQEECRSTPSCRPRCRYEQRPEGVGRNMNIHGLKFLYWTFQDRRYFIIHMPGTNCHKKKRPLDAALSYLGLRA